MIGESLDFTGLDLLMAFGGYLGLFIGASILSLYDISINFFMKMVSKFKSRLISEIKTEKLKLEIEEYNEGQGEKLSNDKSFQPTKKGFSTPHRISPVEMELKNSPILIKIQEDSVKQGKAIKKLEKLLAKQANLEKTNQKYVDSYSFRKEVWK